MGSVFVNGAEQERSGQTERAPGQPAQSVRDILGIDAMPVREGGLCFDSDGNLYHVIEIRGDVVLGHEICDCRMPWTPCESLSQVNPCDPTEIETLAIGKISDCVGWEG